MADWLDILANGTKPSDISDASFQGTVQGIQLRQQQQAERQRQQDGVRLNQYRSNVGDMLKSGDYMGAAGLAYAAGDDKAGTGFGTLQKQHYDQGETNLGHQGEIYRAIGGLPYEQRRAAMQAVKPQLMAMGHSSEETDAFDPTDKNVAPFMGVGYSAHDRASDVTATGQLAVNQQNADINQTNADTQRFSAENQRYTVGDTIFDRDGHLVATAPKTTVLGQGDQLYQSGAVDQGDYSPGGAYTRGAIGNAEAGSAGYGAYNPATGAFGKYQFLPSTAAGIFRQNASSFPELAGMSPRQQLDYAKAHPEVQEKMQGLYEQPAMAALKARGLPVTNLNMHMTQFLGPTTGAAFASLPANTDAQTAIRQLAPKLADTIIAKNPAFRAGSTVGSVMQAMAANMGGSTKRATPGGIVAKGTPKTTPGQDVNGNYDPNMIEQQAKTYILTGKMPQLGQGSGPLRTVILNRASQYMTENNMSPAQVQTVRAQHNALSGSLSSQQKAYSTAMGQLGTFNSSLQHWQDAGSTVANTNSPLINSVSNAFHHAIGDPVTAIQEAGMTAGGEYVKLMIGMGQSSEGARADAAKLFDPNLSPRQRQANADMARANIAARRQSYEQQIAVTQRQIAGLLPRARSEQPTAPSRAAPAVGQTVTRNGRSYQWTGSTWRPA